MLNKIQAVLIRLINITEAVFPQVFFALLLVAVAGNALRATTLEEKVGRLEDHVQKLEERLFAAEDNIRTALKHDLTLINLIHEDRENLAKVANVTADGLRNIRVTVEATKAMVDAVRKSALEPTTGGLIPAPYFPLHIFTNDGPNSRLVPVYIPNGLTS